MRNAERIEADITELWAHINAATYRFLKLLAEFDRNEGWARHGLVNCAQWLNWQCGIGAETAREKVRVARALEALPKIGAAFEHAELSYSKVRAITRVATPANEADLLDIARHATAAQLERIVGQYRRVRRREDADRTMAQHRERYLYCYHDDEGALVVEAKLPPEVGALVRRALDEAAEWLEREGETDPDDVESVSAETAGGARSATAVRAAVSAETAGCAQLAADAPGAGDGSPNDEVSDAEHERPTAAMSRADALYELARHFLSARRNGSASSADRYQVVVHIAQPLLTDERPPSSTTTATVSPATPPTALAGPHCCELDDGRALAIDTVRRLACDGALVGMVEDENAELLSVGRKTRAIPPALQRALKARDGGCCRFPGCTHTRRTEGHHVVHWADGGETKLHNIITLCRFHHKLVHEGGFGLAISDSGDFVFSRPDGSPIPRVGPAGRNPTSSFRGSGETSLFALNRAHGVEIGRSKAGSNLSAGRPVGKRAAIEQRRDVEER